MWKDVKMEKTIDKRVLNERGKNEKIIRKVSRLMPKVTPDISSQEVCDEFAKKYSKAIYCELREVDLMIKKSEGHMFDVVRGSYSHN